jgi:hypothetical protein
MTTHTGHVQQKDILSRNIPDNLKLSIAKRIERGLFSKVSSVAFLGSF